jgi:hypothetical protein
MPTPAYLNVDIINPSTGTTVAVNGTFVGSPNLDPSNIAIGVAPTGIAVTSHNNTLIGGGAGLNMTLGYQNTAIGTTALLAVTTGWDNTAVGTTALMANTSGKYNVVIGNEALKSNTTGNNSVAVGFEALKVYTSLPGQTAIGFGALKSTVTGIQNTAVGLSSLGLATGSSNTSVGHQSLVTLTSGNNNTALGTTAGYLFNSGSNNTFVGNQAGYNFTSGTDNVLLGFANSATASLQTGNNNILIGAGACYPSVPNVSNEITFGNSSSAVLRCAVTSITSLSDARDKDEITELSAGLDFINDIKPVSFIWKDRNEEGKQGIKDSGFTAQNLKEVQEKYNVSEEMKLVYEANPEKLEASYSRLMPILVKAIQELSDKVEELQPKKK